jgi:hypothetical protein
VPLQDRAEYRAWLARRDAEDRRAGRGGNAEECAHCGVGADEHALHGESCVVCLAEQFGIDSTEERIAGLVRSFVLVAAGDQRAFVRLFQEATWALSEVVDAPPAAS